MNQAIFDLKGVLGEDDPDFEREILEILLENLPDMVRAIEEARAARNARALAQAAHSLKGALLTVGARAAEPARQMELAGQSQNLDAAEGLWPDLERELQLLEQTVRAHLGG